MAADEEASVPVSILGLMAQERREARELMAQIRNEQAAGFASLAAKLDAKADKADVESIRSDLRHLGERTEHLEGWRRDEDARFAVNKQHVDREDKSKNRRLALGGLIGTLVVALATVLPIVIR